MLWGCRNSRHLCNRVWQTQPPLLTASELHLEADVSCRVGCMQLGCGISRYLEEDCRLAARGGRAPLHDRLESAQRAQARLPRWTRLQYCNNQQDCLSYRASVVSIPSHGV